MPDRFTGAARRITAPDIDKAAASIGCDVAALRAVMAVESRSSGYDAKGRPIILFEPHVFMRNLPAGSERQLRAQKEGLAYARWGARPYPKTSDGNYDRLSRAIEIDEEAAFRSISIGMGQVLGENFRAGGHSSAVEMFEAAKASEAEQLRQMLGFIRAERIDDDLRARNWRNFAHVYNGPGQIDKYAAQLEREYRKWSRIISVTREKVTAAELRAAGSRTIAATDQIKTAAQGVAAASAAASAVVAETGDVVARANDAVTGVKAGAGYMELLRDYWQVGAIIILLLVIIYFAWRAWRGAHKAAAARVDDARSGASIGRI